VISGQQLPIPSPVYAARKSTVFPTAGTFSTPFVEILWKILLKKKQPGVFRVTFCVLLKI